MKIDIYVEILQASFKHKLTLQYIIWSTLKKFDSKGVGKLSFDTFKKVCFKLFNTNSNYVYTRLSKGDEIFWRKNGRIIYLTGINHIAKIFNISTLSKKMFEIETSEISKKYSISLVELKSYLANYIRCYRDKETIISNNATAEMIGCSKRTIQNYNKYNENNNVTTKQNFALVQQVKTIEEANSLVRFFNDFDNAIKYRKIIKNNNIFVVYQMANSYCMENIESKKNNRYNIFEKSFDDSYKEKVYYPKNKNLGLYSSFKKYKKINIWKENNV